MSSLRFTRFGGLNRSVTDRHIATHQASAAHNTELRDGALRSYRLPALIKADTTVTDFAELPQNDACCTSVLCFNTCSTVTFPLDPDCGGFTSAIVWPEDCSIEPYRHNCADGVEDPLLMPAPTASTTAVRTTIGTLQADENHGPDTRTYTITFVDKYGVESAPAMPSAPTQAYDDETWDVTNNSPVPAHAVCVRVYRATSEFGSGTDAPQQDSTSFQLVEEVEVADWTGTFTDDMLLKDLCFGSLDTIFNCHPPACICGVAETEAGYHVGFVGQELWFSERNEPDNWQERYRVTLPYEIVGIAVNGDLVYVGTKGNPFLVRTGAQLDDLTEDMILRVDPVPYDQMYPMVGRRNIVATAWGAAYVGKEGIVGLQPTLPARVITRQHLDEDLWRQYAPNRLAWLNGRLYAGRWPVGPGFIMDVRGEPEGPADLGDFVTVDLMPNNLRATKSGRLLYSDDTGVHEWDAGLGRMEYTWKSKRVMTTGIEAMHAAKVVGDYGQPLTFRLFGDDRLVYERTIDHCRPFRLPPRGKSTSWHVELTGTTVVHEVHVSSSIAEMAVQAAQEQA